MNVNDIIEIIEKMAPRELAYDWDNTGFLIGDKNKEVKNIYITLDLFKENVDEAILSGADMIISHHPIMFRGIKTIDYGTNEGYILKSLIKNDIAVYAAHTSMDCAKGGINDILAEKLGLCKTEVIEENPNYKNCGLGRIGDLGESFTLKEYAEYVKEKLKTPFVRVCGDLGKMIKRVAVGGGACDDLIPSSIKIGADVLVTADMKYHISADAVDDGIAIIDAGHFPTEVFVIDIFEKLLKEENINIIKSTKEDVFKIV